MFVAHVQRVNQCQNHVRSRPKGRRSTDNNKQNNNNNNIFQQRTILIVLTTLCALFLLYDMSKKLKKTKKATVPSSVIDEMRAGGADYSAAQFMGRDIIKCNSGDEAAKVYLTWMDGVTDDPDVQAIWAPTAAMCVSRARHSG